MLSPVVLFTYCRPDHVRRTIEALQENKESSKHELIIFSDGAREPGVQAAVDQVRDYLETVSGFRSVTIHKQKENLGLSQSIIQGVGQVLRDHESIIVLEDDMVTSPYFLSYMNSALDRFANDDRVISIHGYCCPVDDLPEAFFLLGADCWGWATWRRGWQLFNQSGQALLDELKQRKLVNTFDYNGAYPYSRMLSNQIQGKNDSWAIRWHASAFLAEKLTLYPGRSLVQNIGNDSSGTHCGSETIFDVDLSATPIDLTMVQVSPSEEARSALEDYFRNTRESFVRKMLVKIKKTLILNRE